ncbi:MAG: signal peptide peptidase SppA [Acidobacteria bacterium]|nr:signal peptide peptidase SppA [Acidobacteriota bacterium]
MTRKAKYWLIGVCAVAGFLVVMVVLAVRGGGVPDHSVLVLRLHGPIGEQPSTSAIERILEGRADTILGLRDLLHAAAKDGRISALLVKVGGLQIGMAKAEDLRDQILHFRETGKPVVALMEMGSTLDYYVASACDQIYLVPEGMLFLRGAMADVPFLRGTLDKLRIVPDFVSIGRYKSFADIFTRTDMSPAHREVIDSLLDQLHAKMRDTIAEARNLEPSRVEAIIDRAIYRAPQALEVGLADAVLYEDEVLKALEERLGADLEPYSHAEYEDSLRPSSRGTRVAVVYATGDIMPGHSSGGLTEGSTLGSDTMAEILGHLREDDDVKAVVLRVDSPGGSVTASDLIGHEIALTREKKPVVVSMSDVAASGGYWISAPASRVVARAGTLTGSIGVLAGKFNLQGFYEWLGVRREIITRGENADLFSDYRSFSPQQRELLRSEMEAVYEKFLVHVSENRGLDMEQVKEAAEGRVWTGTQAKALGLVDVLGGFDAALEEVRQLAGIDADRPLKLEYYPKEKGLVESLLSGDLARSIGSLKRLLAQIEVLSQLTSEPGPQAREILFRMDF